ncbi:MAG: polyhydroxyalkanoate depolymerase [Rhodospirillales bacterium]|nr:polyhydroxyalkanoate depolymerase [Rhodospirillales bacterium]
MLYHFYDLQHALLTPARLSAEAARMVYQHPLNPLSYTQAGRTFAAGAELFERVTRRFGAPNFDLPSTTIDGKKVAIVEEDVLKKPFCNLLHFKRKTKRKDPKVLVVAPMSGHYATLLRGTVEALLPHHDVYITDWLDTRQVPLREGRFNLDDYIAYLIEFLEFLGPPTHVIAVCQPAVPVFAAAAVMEAQNMQNAPRTMTLMGGPIDPRVSKTQVTELAEQRPLSWFENTVVTEVPFYYPGAYRNVYPGFIQLGGFMSMNLDRHVGSHMQFYHHLVNGDGESAESHRKFYNEYLSVMDISADFYLQTVETVFQKHALPKGEMYWRDPATGRRVNVDPKKITKTAMLTIEGELDDISAHGQTTAAHDLTKNLSANRQYHHFQMHVGHYGIFNGSRWRTQIMPRIRHMARRFDKGCDPVPDKDLAANPDKRPAQWNKSVHGIDAVRARLRKQAELEGRIDDILQAHE